MSAGAGALRGGSLGARGGAIIGAFFGPEGVPVGAVIGGVGGAVVGGVAGWYGAEWVANHMSNADEKAGDDDGTDAASDTDTDVCATCDPCEKINVKLNKALAKVKQRHAEMEGDFYGMKGGAAPAGKGDWRGHIGSFEQAKNRLNNLIKKAKNKGCPIPSDAEEWGKRDAPSK